MDSERKKSMLRIQKIKASDLPRTAKASPLRNELDRVIEELIENIMPKMSPGEAHFVDFTEDFGTKAPRSYPITLRRELAKVIRERNWSDRLTVKNIVHPETGHRIVYVECFSPASFAAEGHKTGPRRR